MSLLGSITTTLFGWQPPAPPVPPPAAPPPVTGSSSSGSTGTGGNGGGASSGQQSGTGQTPTGTGGTTPAGTGGTTPTAPAAGASTGVGGSSGASGGAGPLPVTAGGLILDFIGEGAVEPAEESLRAWALAAIALERSASLVDWLKASAAAVPANSNAAPMLPARATAGAEAIDGALRVLRGPGTAVRGFEARV